jgi:hypothetical protein
MRRARVRVLRRLSRRADPARAAALRSLRLPRRVAGEAVRRVQRQEDRVRERAGRDRLRRAGAAVRPGVEGARAAAPRPRGGRNRRRDAVPSCRRCDRVRPGRRGAGAAPGPPAGRGARARARPCLGAAGCALPPAVAVGRASARAWVAGAATERSRCVRPGPRVACPSLSGRRHLHERRNGRRRRVRASAGRRTTSGGGDVGTRRSLSRGLGPPDPSGLP